jgi:hypothetical protein
MRRLRMTIGLAATVTALALVAAPAYAHETPKMFFGEFFANIPGSTVSPASPAAFTGKGTFTTLTVGPYTIKCNKNEAEPSEYGNVVRAKGEVTAERSTEFTTDVKFSKCDAIERLPGDVEAEVAVKFSKGLQLEFRSNGSAHLQDPESEVKILGKTSAEVKAAGNPCKVIIPEQSIPTNSEKDPNKEYDSAEYATNEEELEGAKAKKFPEGIQDKLNIVFELKLMRSYVPVEPKGKCHYPKEPEGKYNEEAKAVEYTGQFDGEFENLTIKNGNLGFTTEEAEA